MGPVFVLGRRFSGLVAIRPSHELVTGGVYGVIGHRSYLGLIVKRVRLGGRIPRRDRRRGRFSPAARDRRLERLRGAAAGRDLRIGLRRVPGGDLAARALYLSRAYPTVPSAFASQT